jgi:AcrR family transcriptional regulator
MYDEVMNESVVKNRILDVAANLFYTQGYNLTGINQIIEESDIARASLYNHFKSKTDLLLAYLQKADDQLLAEIEDFLRPFTDPKEKLLALMDYRLLRQKRLGFAGCPFVKISLEISKKEEEKVIEITNAHKEKFKKLLKQLVTPANHRQMLTDDLLTETIFLLLEGSSIHGAMTKSPQTLKKAKKIVENLL